MKKTPMPLVLCLLLPAVFGFFSSCGDKSADEGIHEPEDLSDVGLADEELLQGEIDPEYRKLLDQSPAATLPENDLQHGGVSSSATKEENPIAPAPTDVPGNLIAQDKEGVNVVIEAIDRTNQEQEVEITKLKSLVAAQYKRIHEYRILNEDLKKRNQDLRKTLATTGSGSISAVSESVTVEQLRKRLANLKNDFAMRTKDLYDSQEQARILQSKIEQMEIRLRGENFNPLITEPTGETAGPAVVPLIKDTGKLLPLDPVSETLPPPARQPDVGVKTGGSGRFEFQAAITEASGKTREAFYTEFFVTKSHLDDILTKADLDLSNYNGIGSYSELWARVRKNEFRFPKLQRHIREALLAAVDADQGRRIRTDIDGSSPVIDGLEPGSYFIIGTAPLGQVGVTWSLPVLIERTSDKRVALTLNNSSWSL